MSVLHCNITFIIILISLLSGSPYTSDSYEYDYPEDYSSDDDFLNENEKVVHTIPQFVSKPIEQMVNEGETIKLPCIVDKLGKNNWKYNLKFWAIYIIFFSDWNTYL